MDKKEFMRRELEKVQAELERRSKLPVEERLALLEYDLLISMRTVERLLDIVEMHNSQFKELERQEKLKNLN